jgi:hypothetical protein
MDKRSRFYIGGELPVVREKLANGLQYILSRQDLRPYHERAEQALAVLNIPVEVEANTEGLRQVEEAVLEELQERQTESRELLVLLEDDFDTFMEQLDTQTLIDADADHMTSYPVSLYTTNQQTTDLLDKQPAPVHSYIDLHRGMVDGYAEALASKSHYELDMNQLEHQSLSNYFTDLQDRIAQVDGQSARLAQ